MLSSNTIILTIIGCSIVTWLSRILPFVLLQKFTLHSRIIEFLQFVPIVIMSTLWFSSLFTPHQGHLPQLNLAYLLTTIPSFLAAVISKSLLVIVAVGIISLAIIRSLGIA
ncbi:hypothetical protein FC62_GL000138 [Amylolactobacillus amylotrophicus DSM 20534]|uniref:Uncharacterized protein n=3 Tax=Amylolactobacillus TaxID=2767876 RepID=A0A0R1YSU3_9LACO|nr:MULTISPECIES: AzlD domain-containing protein [Amylolactobacillus]APT17848.1 branched-chain amino acid ABC transporter [Amylolactobacillus amylophilus DSM 20533 = JCM 1125]KRK38452.1 hypothetical protein FC62_GL000138 [Amylolactobacillus amylotrophicus DSM 20534]KRM42905.1 hypothetical protein FD40_GL000701 [Amylolactobacillus amylophilus DSM 20533 = JCM 1125]GED79770.1 branched-chain amino acid ABC transporter [Amylolactobacillus amylophilus]